ncbi:MAG TPA: pyruvate dehydrogenase complex E1 component subunit beta [Actinomycetes bacterium]|jgi:pyruvate/2-oxoglutarate/acetoin dehydrogenase E1 component/TPP-dependent pyruvate/acetoin dehydrogenase alpha subunit|nr:pyruvate dehydrogenase complex E1 component subunit beta [Actinomycetes bacterium]
MTAPDVLPAHGIDADELLVLYEQMAVIRRTEKAAHDLFMSGVVKGTTHLAAGQEAVAVGASAALRPDDYVFATYRGHHHAMARGASPEECLAELMSKATGLCKAKGGSMHLTKAAVGMLGSYAIVGSHLPMAAGAAWSARLRESDQVAVAFFGDGATNIGAFHEALNLASVWRLPVLFICENNLYMEYTPISAVTAADNPAADRAPAYRMPGEVIDGNDVVLVRDAVQEAADRARRGDGPTLIEAQTYRHYGHSRADPAKYRPAEEVERWLKHDPLDIARARLEALGVGPQAVEEADARAARTVEEAVDAAKNAPEPDPEQAFTDVWADGGAAWRTPAFQVSARIASQQPPAEILRPARSESTEEPPTITYREAVAEGIAREMRRDPTVVCLGEDIGAAEGVFKTTVGLFAEFGAQRVWDTPISEQAIAGAAMGAAMTGMRPVAEIMFSDFLACCWDYLANEIPKVRYMTGGQVTVPLVIRTANGGGLGFGAQHSQAVENWVLTVPGLKIAAPSTPADVIGLMAAAIRSDDPVVFFEHKGLFASKGEVAPPDHLVELGQATIRRPGSDVTIAALASTVPIALAAADELAHHGISAEVIDLRCLVPLDVDTVLRSLEHTSKLLVVEENPYQGGWGATLVSIVADEGFELLDAPIKRVAAANVPLPFADALEEQVIPTVEKVVEATNGLAAY